ncbi:hypothetical protein [Kitasatospora sp. NPDC004272]
MKEYFKTLLETWHGNDATLYIEFTNGVPTRQVSNVGERWLSSRDDFDDDIGMLLTEPRLTSGEFSDGDRITPEEFEDLWEKTEPTENHS